VIDGGSSLSAYRGREQRRLPGKKAQLSVEHASMSFIMAALCNRADHYIFIMWFLSSIFYLFSSPNLSGRRLDVYHTSTHDVALVRI